MVHEDWCPYKEFYSADGDEETRKTKCNIKMHEMPEVT